MSVVGYCKLKHRCTKEINWESESEWLIPTYKDLTRGGSVDEITDVNSFLAKLEEGSLLGIDRLDVLKDLLKEMAKWDLLRTVDEFEIKRKDYKQFLERISRALDESNELQRLILICKRQNLIAHEREGHIANVNELFTELEQQNNLGIGNLSILKTMATEVERPDLCRLVDDFDEKRKQEEDGERKRKEWEHYKLRARAQVASVLVGGINIGERLIGVVTPHCTYRNVNGVAVVVTTWMVLRRSPNLEAFVNAFQQAVLPLGTYLRALSEGSTRFTIQAENICALDVLWRSYQDETLQTNLQEFLVTEEIKQLAGGDVTLTVHIDEDEYRNSRWDLMISGTEEIKLEEKRGLKDRASSDSDLTKERNTTTANPKDPFPEKEFLSFDRKVRVEEYLENLEETLSEIMLPSDSGAETWSSASSEYGFDKGDRLEKLDQVEGLIKDVIENWNSFQEAFRDAYPFEGRNYHSTGKELKTIRITLGTLREMEEKWMNAEPVLTSSSSAQAIVQQLENSLQLDQGFFKNPTTEDKRAIYVLARKAKNLKRLDVFKYLRKITPPGTTGPRLPDDMLVEEILKRTKNYMSKRLIGRYSRAELMEVDLRPRDMRYMVSTSALDLVVMQYDLRTVGELYDFLCEQGLPEFADYL